MYRCAYIVISCQTLYTYTVDIQVLHTPLASSATRKSDTVPHADSPTRRQPDNIYLFIRLLRPTSFMKYYCVTTYTIYEVQSGVVLVDERQYTKSNELKSLNQSSTKQLSRVIASHYVIRRHLKTDAEIKNSVHC